MHSIQNITQMSIQLKNIRKENVIDTCVTESKYCSK